MIVDDVGQKNIFWATIHTQNLTFLDLFSSQVMIGKPLWCSWQHFSYGVSGNVLHMSMVSLPDVCFMASHVLHARNASYLNRCYQQVSSCKFRNTVIQKSCTYPFKQWPWWLIEVQMNTILQLPSSTALILTGLILPVWVSTSDCRWCCWCYKNFCSLVV
jgi:hypothetical protein